VGAEGKIEQDEALGIGDRVKRAVMWRSGSQIVAQAITWGATFLVIRLLDPKDYGLFAMTQVVLVFLNLMNGYGFANALVRDEAVTRQKVRQAFGMLILLNGSLAVAQLIMAPIAAAYFRQPVIADLLRVQALLYLSTPFTAMPSALLSRDMSFRKQAQVDLIAAFASAATMLTLAYLGFGVWTLVIGAVVLFWTRAVGLAIAARWLVPPSFRFKGAGAMFRYGGAMVVVQFFWFVQSQGDVFIAGRVLGPHELGLYTTALFLAQILTHKFLPPLNDVAFAAYSRIQGDRDAVAFSFLKSVRLIMLIAMPFYLGLAATAEPLVLTVLGEKWAETAPLVRIVALAMPFMTLQLLFTPATNALGRPGIALRIAVSGALILPAAFLIGIQWGMTGMAWAWLAGFPIQAAVTAALALPVIGVRAPGLARAIMPGLAAAAAMAASVLLLDRMLPPMAVQPRLAILVCSGGAAYGALLFLFARNVIEEAIALARKRPSTAAAAP
jgi:O-antigen/teichoic acid export membrane protein